MDPSRLMVHLHRREPAKNSSESTETIHFPAHESVSADVDILEGDIDHVTTCLAADCKAVSATRCDVAENNITTRPVIPAHGVDNRLSAVS